MTNNDPADAAREPDADMLASAVQVTTDVVAGVGSGQLALPTPCPDMPVAKLLDHLVGYATNFADKVHGVQPPADPVATTAGSDPLAAYREATARLVDGYRRGSSEDSTPLGVALIETITHGWDLAMATGQKTAYPEDAVIAAFGFANEMLQPRFRGAGMPFGDEVDVSADALALNRLVGFMGRDPDWKP